MKQVSVKEAKDTLPALIRAVENGEDVTITRNGKPVVDVVVHKRKGGLDFEGFDKWKKEHGIDQLVGPIPDDFDDPLPWDFLFTQSL